MSARGWLPSEWMDETVPATGDSPDAFLMRGPGDDLYLAAADPIERADDSPSARLIGPGEIIEFSWHEDRGRAVLVVREDGSWYLDPPFDDGEVNCISDADGDIIAQTVEDYVAQRREPTFGGGGEGLPPDSYELWGWYWSDGTSFRVKVLESGTATFEEVPSDGA